MGAVLNINQPMHDKAIELASYIPKFLLFKQVKDNTAQTYYHALNHYLSNCNSPLNSANVHAYIERLKETHSMLTIKSNVGVIRDFCKYLNDHEVAENKIHGQVQFNYEYRGGNKSVIDDDKFKAMLDTCDLATVVGLRDYAFLRLLQSTGMRVNEPLGCTMEDISMIQHPLGEKVYLLSYEQKRGYKAIVRLFPKTYDAIMAYRRFRGAEPESSPLFMSHNRSGSKLPYNVKNAEKMIRMRMNAVGLTGSRYTAHSFRYTQAIKALELTGDEHKASQQLRHLSPKTIQYYTADYRAKFLGLNMINLEV